MVNPTSTRGVLAEATDVIPGGYNSNQRGIAPPIAIRRAQGAYFEDVEGRRYLDYHAAFGPMVLGHCYPEVVDAVASALRETDLYGVGTTEMEVALARKIVDNVPSVEEVLLCNSGSEATYHAIRLARAATGRSRRPRSRSEQHLTVKLYEVFRRNFLTMPVNINRLEEAAVELNRRAAVATPLDARRAHKAAADRETNKLAKYVLNSIVDNSELAVVEERPMCGDTGVPRYYVKAGNDVQIEGGFAALEHALRRALATATHEVKLRSNRVHPLTRRNPGNNVGVFAPNIDYRFEPEGDWIDITAVHKGGLFGSDYRMLFPGDGIPGIKRFVVDTIASFHRRGMACPPAIVGVGIGGTKDQSFSLSKEAACLRLVGDRHPDPTVAQLEDELLELCNSTQMGVMGLKSDTPVIDVHCEIAYAHTGGTPVGVSELCTAVRRCTMRLYNDGRLEFREDPLWFNEYMRREGIEWELPSWTQSSAAGPLEVN